MLGALMMIILIATTYWAGLQVDVLLLFLFYKANNFCIPWSERLGNLPNITQLRSIKVRIVIHKVWQKSLYFQGILGSGAESLYREGRQKKVRGVGGGRERERGWWGVWNPYLIGIGSSLRLRAQERPGKTFEKRTLGGRYENSLNKERVEAGKAADKHKLIRACNKEGQGEWKSKIRREIP